MGEHFFSDRTFLLSDCCHILSDSDNLQLGETRISLSGKLWAFQIIKISALLYTWLCRIFPLWISAQVPFNFCTASIPPTQSTIPFTAFSSLFALFFSIWIIIWRETPFNKTFLSWWLWAAFQWRTKFPFVFPMSRRMHGGRGQPSYWYYAFAIWSYAMRAYVDLGSGWDPGVPPPGSYQKLSKCSKIIDNFRALYFIKFELDFSSEKCFRRLLQVLKLSWQILPQ